MDCISKGKARTPYEFSVKVGIVSTLKGNLIVGAKAFHGNPYDGHTLNEQWEQATILMQDIWSKPATVFVDLGYRGVDADNPDVHEARPSGSASRTESCSNGPKRSNRSLATSRPITAWTAATSRVNRATGCTRCCVRRATTSNGCCA